MNKQNSQIDSLLNPVTSEIDSSKVAEMTKVGRVVSAEDAKMVLDIYDRYRLMKQWREKSCPWGKPITSYKTETTDENNNEVVENATEVMNSATDWEVRWKRDRDLTMMKAGKNKFNDELPAVASPIIWSIRQTILAQYQDGNTSVMIDPKIGIDPVIAKVAKAYITDLETNAGIRKTKISQVFPEAIDCGTAITYNSYVCQKRKVKMLKTLEELMEMAGLSDDALEEAKMNPPINEMTGLPLTAEEIQAKYDQREQELKDEIAKNPTKMLVQEQEITDYDDINMEFVPLEEIFIDPGAWDFNTVTRGARDCIWRQFLPVQQAINQYQNNDDPFIIKKNVTEALIKTSSEVSGAYINTNLNKELQDLMNLGGKQNLACVLKYYNRFTDEYVILINDIVVRKGPLPYNHKQLPFSKYVFIPLPRSFYGIGLGTLLDETQQSSEFFESLRSYVAEVNNNKPMTVQGDDISEGLQELIESNEPLKAGQIIRIGSNDNIQPIITQPMDADADKVQNTLKDNAVLISGINPAQSALPDPDLAVRSQQIGQESALTSVRMYVNNFENGYVDFVKQVLLIAKQVEPLNYEKIEDTTENQNKNPEVKKQLKKYKQLKTPGVSFEMEDEDGQKSVKMSDSIEGSGAELTPNIVEKFDQLEVSVRVETTQLASRALQAKDLQDTLTLAMAIRGNPAFKDDKIVSALFRSFLDKKNTEPKIMALLQDEQSEESDELADVQNTIMESGQAVQPIAGMNENHKAKHTAKLMELFVQRDNLDAEASQLQPQLESLMQTPGMEPELTAYLQENAQKRDQISKTIDLMTKHLTGDMQAKTDGDIAAVTIAQAQNQPPQPANPNPQMSPPPKQQQGQQMPMNPMPPMGQ
jgi:hypothetical protein